MKVQCPKCREIILMEEFSTSEEGLRFQCTDCEEINFIPNQQHPANEEYQACPANDTSAIPAITIADSINRKDCRTEDEKTITCPKCGHAQSNQDACNLCGLQFSEFIMSTLPADPPEAMALWEKVLEKPNDLDLHEKFLTACKMADRVDFATRQYRILGREQGNADIAQSMMSRILNHAQLQLNDLNLKTEHKTNPRQKKWILLLVIVLLAVVGFIGLSSFAHNLLTNMQ